VVFGGRKLFEQLKRRHLSGKLLPPTCPHISRFFGCQVPLQPQRSISPTVSRESQSDLPRASQSLSTASCISPLSPKVSALGVCGTPPVRRHNAKGKRTPRPPYRARG
jgi:hypothetical protein